MVVVAGGRVVVVVPGGRVVVVDDVLVVDVLVVVAGHSEATQAQFSPEQDASFGPEMEPVLQPAKLLHHPHEEVRVHEAQSYLVGQGFVVVVVDVVVVVVVVAAQSLYTHAQFVPEQNPLPGPEGVPG